VIRTPTDTGFSGDEAAVSRAPSLEQSFLQLPASACHGPECAMAGQAL